MRCAGCGVENKPEAVQCQECGHSLTKLGRVKSRKRRRKKPAMEEADSPFSPDIELPNLPAAKAYRVSVWSIIPGVGLFLGPLGIMLGVIARWRGRSVPGFTARHLAKAAVVLGFLTGATNWTGLALIWMGLRR
jgi:hypothetical protein